MKAKLQTILAAFVLVLVACPAFAQDKIVKLIDQMEKQDGVTTTYTERRTRKKHKLYRTTRVLTFENTSLYKRLERAFEDERPNSIMAVKSNGTHTYKFADAKGTSTFTLSPNSVMMVWRDESVEEGEEDGSYLMSPLGLESLAELSSLGSLDCLSNEQLDKLVTWAEDARRQADEARKQADNARKQTAKARDQAAKARDQAAKARSKARKQSTSSHTKTTVYVDGQTYYF